MKLLKITLLLCLKYKGMFYDGQDGNELQLGKKKISQIFQVNSCVLKNDPNCNYHHCVLSSLNNFICQLISAI